MPADKQPIPSVWMRPQRQQPQPALSRAQIVSEAIQLLDAEGIEALSMRRLGTRLGAAATSLYRHVANKDELIELVVDEVYGEVRVPPADDPAGWRQAVGDCARSMRSTILRHPWLTAVLGQVGLVYLGPNMMRTSDRLLAIVRSAGFGAGEADQAISAVVAYVIGMSTSEAAFLSLLSRSGYSEQEWVEKLWPAAEAAVQEHPQLREEYAAQRGKDQQQAREENFVYGLERILDGLESRLRAVGGPD
ncbi:TetR/AcrR family transcriptional regulator [Nonomuraea africana]|uniref:AcrR family transcriptional regulator n=1 Tax=Nonomuraea africana TaxID=46171 RepID=A0ABR9KRN9_9ACTN|nr:TetR/AcrR family transcriptional regulator [Nonomuraea africana]MBE1564695.1 AcrR family transcriptional regulator [Nonomuraea africana]